MTMLTRWDPFRELNVLQDRMNRLFQDFLPRGEQELTAGNFAPPVDIYEDEHAITVNAELPGIDPKDVDVRVENNTLTIQGERKFEKEEKEENFHRIERRYGNFIRSFTLPNTVDTDNVKADFDNGLLRIQLAKRAEAKPKQIKVNVGQKALEGKGKAA
ncbi:MAG TPA: Hsp20/alpha crystallin family protein [Terriglobales bacterium]|jgi:HSP20 family protein|nr:Hsp20/alpha crystallin family protein [Terriglobales bacterium]